VNEYLQSSIPSHWNLVPINELTELIRGVSYKRGDESTQKVEGYIPIYRANNIQNNLIEDDLYYIPHSFVGDKQYLQEGDILLSLSSGSKKAVGKATLIKENGKGTFGTFCGVLRPKRELVNPLFLSYFFKTSNYRENISDLAGGLNINNISKGHFSKIFIPLPPMNEQLLIIDVVEKLLARVNTVKERLDRVPTIMQQFRQSVLAAACSGRLTKDWREIGVIKEQINDQEQRFINSIENRDTINRNFKKYPSFEDLKETYNHISIPSTWHIGNLNTLWNEDEVVKTGPFGAILKSKEFVTQGIPVLAVGNVKEGFLDLTDTHLDYITEIKAEELLSYRLKTGDIVFTRSGTIGRSSVIPENADGWMMSYHLLRVRVNNQYIYPQFLHYVFSGCIFTKEYILDSIIGTTRPGINTSILANMPIPIPTQLEQTEIIRRVDALFKYATRIESKIANTHEQIEEITQSILHQAFTGKLVPTRIESE
jgi:type I restriction enzyme S subunit